MPLANFQPNGVSDILWNSLPLVTLMLYLLLQIVFASAFTLLIKWVHVRDREDVITIGAINYIVAALAIVPAFLIFDPAPISTGAMITGGSMGAIYFIAFFFAIYAIKMVGASSTTVVSVLSILLPIGVAALFWKERPNVTQTVGIAMALLALTLIGAQTNRTPAENENAVPKWIIPTVLFGFFLLCGCSRLSQDAFKHFSQPEHRPTFILSAFTVAAIPSLILMVYRRRKLQPFEIVFGVLMGLSNILQTHYILRALEYFEGFIVFPVTSAGGILLTTLIATGLLGEKLNRRTCVGIVISVFAMFLLYWIPG